MGNLKREVFVFLMAIIQCACTSAPDPEDLYICAPEKFENGAVLVLTTNYETSSLDLFHPSCATEVRRNRIVASGDAILRKVGNRPLVLNRGSESNLMVLDESLEIVSQIALVGCGPHDVLALDENNLLVSCYESSMVKKVSLDEERVEPWLDLGGFSGGDGFPEMDALAMDDSYLYVTLQNLDRRNNWLPEKPGTLLVFERGNLNLVDEITLPCDNPYTSLSFRDASTLWVGCAGSWSGGNSSGSGIVSLNLDTWDATSIYDDQALNGRPTFLVAEEGLSPLVVSATPSASNAWDIDRMQVLSLDGGEAQSLYVEPGFSLGGIQHWSDNKLLIAQRTFDDRSGVLIFNLETLEVESRWQTGLLPAEFIISD